MAKTMPNQIKINDIVEVHHAFLRATDYGITLSDSLFTQIRFVSSFNGVINSSIGNISQSAESITCNSWESTRSLKTNSLITITTTLINAELRANKFISL